ncbi:hypothetical protein GEMRC1_000384 [Eukaryota sp. GEM-RC1]
MTTPELESDTENFTVANALSFALNKAKQPSLKNKSENLHKEVDKVILEEKIQRKVTHLRRHAREKFHVLPSAEDAAYERSLLKIGTKGVVKLFNAISEHQRQQRSNDRPQSTKSFAELIDSKRSAPPHKTSRPSGDILDEL